MARPSFEVRRARAQDLDDLLGLLVESREDVPAGLRGLQSADHQILRPRLDELVAGGQTQFLLARQDGRPVGFLAVRSAPITVLSDSLAMHIDQLYVVVDQRRHGVGRALISAVAGLAERAGAEQVICSVSPQARETHRFFARLGFAPILVRRMVPTSTLRRRLAGGESRRGGLDELLSRRRSLRARSLWPGSDRAAKTARPEPVDQGAGAPAPGPAAPPTLELPVIEAEAALLEPAVASAGVGPQPPEQPTRAGEPVRTDPALA